MKATIVLHTLLDTFESCYSAVEAYLWEENTIFFWQFERQLDRKDKCSIAIVSWMCWLDHSMVSSTFGSGEGL